jgi:hypothetical protein
MAKRISLMKEGQRGGSVGVPTEAVARINTTRNAPVPAFSFFAAGQTESFCTLSWYRRIRLVESIVPANARLCAEKAEKVEANHSN